MTETDVIILGAGAAGLFAAGQAGQRGLRVALLEKTDAPGKKILISGGGRCNFTNLGAGPGNYPSGMPVEPLKAICSRKCASPRSSSRSSRLPEPIRIRTSAVPSGVALRRMI